MGDRIAMSQRERDVLKVMSGVLGGERTQVEAARLLGRSVRQVRRMQRRLEEEGDGAVMHGLRGRPSNRRVGEGIRERVLAEYRRELMGFGPTLASEKLAERRLEVVPETLRLWLTSAGLWERQRKRDRHRRRRERRACFGELVQMDTSIHDWTEGRGEEMVLVAMIDDATSRIEARFYCGETLESHWDLLGRWRVRYGRPRALYTDRDSIFQSQSRGRGNRQAVTQFGRALEELEIELIWAYSPQAKGRVERFFGVAQDRWVKELRLRGVKTRAAANQWLERRLVAEYNQRYSVRPLSGSDAHRGLGPRHHPGAILSVQCQRVVANDYTVRLDNRIYQLEPPAWPGLRGGRVTIEDRLDGTRAIRFRERYLKFHEVAVGGTQSGAFPVQSGSLSHSRPLAALKQKDRACLMQTRSAATRPVAGRSGRTPAEPYPPDGNGEITGKVPDRPAADHPWRRSFLNWRKADISILV